MSMYSVATGPATTRIVVTDQQIIDRRADAARNVIARYAAETPDPEGWARVLAMLGLDQPATAAPVGRLPDPRGFVRDAAKSRRAPSDEPKRPRGRPRRTDDEIEHGTRYAYNHGCRCDPCRDANNTHSRERKRKHRDAVRAARAEAEQ